MINCTFNLLLKWSYNKIKDPPCAIYELEVVPVNINVLYLLKFSVVIVLPEDIDPLYTTSILPKSFKLLSSWERRMYVL